MDLNVILANYGPWGVVLLLVGLLAKDYLAKKNTNENSNELKTAINAIVVRSGGDEGERKAVRSTLDAFKADKIAADELRKWLEENAIAEKK